MEKKVYINKKAEDLFPALFGKIDQGESLEKKPLKLTKSGKYGYSKNLGAPDGNWLRKIIIPDDSAKDTTIHRALILSGDKNHLPIYKTILRKFKFAVEFATSESAAIESVFSTSLSLLIYEKILKFYDFEQYMRNLGGDKRRNLYYVIIGPEFNTLYDLEALCLSTNLVVNSKDIQYLDKILTRGFQDYENLYRPFLEILQVKKESRHL